MKTINAPDIYGPSQETPLVRGLRDGSITGLLVPWEFQPQQHQRILVGNYNPTVVNNDGEEIPGESVWGAYSDDGEDGWVCPYLPGEVIGVREGWNTSAAESDGIGLHVGIRYVNDGECQTFYVTGDDFPYVGLGPNRPAGDMPRWAIRTYLEVTDRQVVQVSGISEEQAEQCGFYIGINPEKTLNDVWQSSHPDQDWAWYLGVKRRDGE